MQKIQAEQGEGGDSAGLQSLYHLAILRQGAETLLAVPWADQTNLKNKI